MLLHLCILHYIFSSMFDVFYYGNNVTHNNLSYKHIDHKHSVSVVLNQLIVISFLCEGHLDLTSQVNRPCFIRMLTIFVVLLGFRTTHQKIQVNRGRGTDVCRISQVLNLSRYQVSMRHSCQYLYYHTTLITGHR